MKGAIIIPTFYKARHEGGNKSQRGRILLNALSKEYSMPLVYTDNPNLSGIDVALIYGVPYHNRPKIPPGLLESSTKLIGYFEDLACWDNQECLKNKKKLFKRFDIILGACYKSYRELYPQFLDKYVHFPNFFFPLERYKKLKLNMHPIMRCIMPGALNSFYPFRMHIRSKARKTESNLIDITRVHFGIYAETLNSYFCAIATPGKMENVVSKYLEIPASGALMLAKKLMELDLMGLKENIHYVPITVENVFNQVRYVLTHPNEFQEMRRKAMNFVHTNHSEVSRINQFGDILRRLR